MRIIHVCLAQTYVDDFSYQENVLPRMHKNQGHSVMILASTETLLENNHLAYLEPSSYTNNDDIPVTRVAYVSWLPHIVASKFRVYQGFTSILETFSPDVIFLHDIQFLSVYQFRKYKRKHPEIKMVADGHADYINSARGFLSKKLLHGVFYRHAASILLPITTKFYGTLPSRVSFFSEMYHIPREKVAFLPMGADDNLVTLVSNDGSREAIRESHAFGAEDVVLVTGGKFDSRKIEVLNLMDAVAKMPTNVKLMIIGSVSTEMEADFNRRLIGGKIVMLGWASEKETYQVIHAGDIAVFPYLHSTLWEQSAGIGLPCIFRRLDGFQHINTHDNCLFVDKCTSENLASAIRRCIKNYDVMKKNAMAASTDFLYGRIAQKVLDDLK